MASLPGAQFNITGASGTAAALVAKSGWKAIVLPRGAHAAADSTGVDVTLDSQNAINRFALNNWIQVGTDISKIRKITLIGAGIRVNSAVTISENDRIFLIGNTQPSTTGGSATYITPNTRIRQRDDDASDLYANSLITSNSDGLIQGWCSPNFYDVLIQDGNQSLQGSIVDLPVGSVGGISTDSDALFGGSVTVNGAFGVTGWATFGSTVTMHAALGVTGWAHFGASVTMHANAGVTGSLTVGSTLTASGVFIGTTVTVNNALGVTGQATFGSTATFSAGVTISGQLAGVSATFSQDVTLRRLVMTRGTTFAITDFTLSSGWGATGSITNVSTRTTDSRGWVNVLAGGSGVTDNPTIHVNFKDGAFPNSGLGFAFANRLDTNAPTTAWWLPILPIGTTQAGFRFIGLPTSGIAYSLEWLVIG